MQEKTNGASSFGDDGEDRINKLPEHIIHFIFSFLETIDVTGARAVSRRWRSLWSTIPYFNFDDCMHPQSSRFRDFVNWVLISRDASVSIQKLRLTKYYYLSDLKDDAEWFYSWVNVAARGGNLKELDLSIRLESLVALKLQMWMEVLELPATAGFQRTLKSLELETLTLTDEKATKSFISGCHRLEYLSLNGCVFRDFKVLQVYNPNLKSLTLHNYYEEDSAFGCSHIGLRESKVEVNCPNLVSFTFQGPSALEFSITNLLSLENAYFLWEAVSSEDDEDSVGSEGDDEYNKNTFYQVLCELQNAKVLGLFPYFVTVQ
ncbi:hypothetical protein Tsubulata_002734 [Turnera subulata]|uniref:F-box domain-containing protein n=1 Tax=Turnera subulata TaxID=218843 RepID=A0A9Q0GFV4_9ROSI|nr:hypothetical protein Tsubulata_002734 [Turnera subulata]